MTDALGRSVEVYEDPAGSNYQTSYSYAGRGLNYTPSFGCDPVNRLTNAKFSTA